MLIVRAPLHTCTLSHQFFPDVLLFPRIMDLYTDELVELIRTIQRVGRVVVRIFKAQTHGLSSHVR